MTLDCCFTILDLLYFLSVGNLVETQLLSYLWTYLSGITIDSLTTTENNIYMTEFLIDFFNSLSKEV